MLIYNLNSIEKEKHNTVTFDEVFTMLQQGVKVANKLLGENGEVMHCHCVDCRLYNQSYQ